MHQTSISPDKKFIVDTYSQVDQPPGAVFRSMKNGKIIMKLEKADNKDLKPMGWQAPEPFKLKARDGKTDIYGAILRPSNFDLLGMPNEDHGMSCNPYFIEKRWNYLVEHLLDEQPPEDYVLVKDKQQQIDLSLQGSAP